MTIATVNHLSDMASNVGESNHVTDANNSATSQLHLRLDDTEAADENTKLPKEADMSTNDTLDTNGASSPLNEEESKVIESNVNITTPILMSSDEKIDHHIDSRTEEKKMADLNARSLPAANENKKRDRFSDSKDMKDDAKKRRIEESKKNDIEVIEEKKSSNGSKVLIPPKHRNDSSLKEIDDSDPKKMQILALISHRKELLQIVQCCKTACRKRIASNDYSMFLSSPDTNLTDFASNNFYDELRAEKNEIEAFKKLSLFVLQNLKKGARTDVGEICGSSLGSGGEPRSLRRISTKKKMHSSPSESSFADVVPQEAVIPTTISTVDNSVTPMTISSASYPRDVKSMNGRSISTSLNLNVKNTGAEVAPNTNPSLPLHYKHTQSAPIQGAISRKEFSKSSTVTTYFSAPHKATNDASNNSSASTNSPLEIVSSGASVNNQLGSSKSAKNSLSSSVLHSGAPIPDLNQKFNKSSSIKSPIPTNASSYKLKKSTQQSLVKSGSKLSLDSQTNMSKSNPDTNTTHNLGNTKKVTQKLNQELKNLRERRNALMANLNSKASKKRLTNRDIVSTSGSETNSSRGRGVANSKVCKMLSAAKLPARRKTHWDYLLEEMRWLATDFIEERKSKIALARTLSCEVHQNRNEFSEIFYKKSSNENTKETQGSRSQNSLGANDFLLPSEADLASVKKVSYLLSDMIRTHWDKLVREGVFSDEGSHIYKRQKLLQKLTTDELSSFQREKLENMMQKCDSENDLNETTSTELKSEQKFSTSKDQLERCKLAERIFQAGCKTKRGSISPEHNFFDIMNSRIKDSTTAADDIKYKIRRLRATEIQKSQLQYQSCGVSLSSSQIRAMRFIDSIWDIKLDGNNMKGACEGCSVILSNVNSFGKTIALSAILWKYRGEGPQLILCPPANVVRWRHELRRFSEINVFTIGFHGSTFNETSKNNMLDSESSQDNVIHICDINALDGDFHQESKSSIWKKCKTFPFSNFCWSSIIFDTRLQQLNAHYNTTIGNEVLCKNCNNTSDLWQRCYDNLLALNCMGKRKVLIESSQRSNMNSNYDENKSRPNCSNETVDELAMKFAFVHASPNNGYARKLNRYSQGEIFSWARTNYFAETSNRETDINGGMCEVLRKAIDPFTLSDEPHTPKPVVLGSNGEFIRKRKSRDSSTIKDYSWGVRKCPLNHIQRNSYAKVCEYTRGSLSSFQLDSFSRYTAAAAALLNLRRSCIHADLKALLCSLLPPVLCASSFQSSKRNRKVIREWFSSVDSWNSAQPNLGVAEVIVRGSAKMYELLNILVNEVGVDSSVSIKENSSLKRRDSSMKQNYKSSKTQFNLTRKEDRDVTKNEKRSSFPSAKDQDKPPKRKSKAMIPARGSKILILASLPEAQLLLHIFLNSCGISHELLTLQKLHSAANVYLQAKSELCLDENTFCASNWAAIQHSIIRYSQFNVASVFGHNNILISSPQQAVQSNGGLKIDFADVIIDFDHDWSERNLSLLDTVVTTCAYRHDNRSGTETPLKLIRLVCANTCEENFLSKLDLTEQDIKSFGQTNLILDGTEDSAANKKCNDSAFSNENKDGDCMQSDSEDKFDIDEFLMYNNKSAYKIETDRNGLIISVTNDENEQLESFLARNILRFQGQLLSHIMANASQPYFTGQSNLLFLGRLHLDPNNSELASTETGSFKVALKFLTHYETTFLRICKLFHHNLSQESKNNHKSNGVISNEVVAEMYFGLILAQTESNASQFWFELSRDSLFHNSSSSSFLRLFSSEASRRDIFTLSSRIYCTIYGKKFFHVLNHSIDTPYENLSNSLELAESWKKSGLGCAANEQVPPLLIYYRMEECHVVERATKKSKRRLMQLSSETIAQNKDDSIESMEKKRRKGKNFSEESKEISSFPLRYRGNYFAQIFSSFQPQLIRDGSQGCEHLLYMPPITPALMIGRNTKIKEKGNTFNVKVNKHCTEKTHVISTKNANLSFDTMDIDDIPADFFDSSENTPLLDFDLSADIPGRDEVLQLDIEPVDVTATAFPNQTAFDDMKIPPLKERSSNINEDARGSEIPMFSGSISESQFVDPVDIVGDMEIPFPDTQFEQGYDMLQLSEIKMDLNFDDALGKNGDFDVGDILDLNTDSMEMLPNLNLSSLSNRVLHDEIEEICNHEDYGLIGCGILPSPADSSRIASITKYDSARYRLSHDPCRTQEFADIDTGFFEKSETDDGLLLSLCSVILHVKKSTSGFSSSQLNHQAILSPHISGACSVQSKNPTSKVKKAKKQSNSANSSVTDEHLSFSFPNNTLEQHGTQALLTRSGLTENNHKAKSGKSHHSIHAYKVYKAKKKIVNSVKQTLVSGKVLGNPISTPVVDQQQLELFDRSKIFGAESSENKSKRGVLLVPAVLKLSDSSNTGDKAKNSSTSQRASLRRSLVAPTYVDFGPFKSGVLSSSAGLSGISPPTSQVGIGLPLGVQPPSREEDYVSEPWSEDEDLKLKAAAARFCFNWHIVSQAVTSVRVNPCLPQDDYKPSQGEGTEQKNQMVLRSARQCRERWQAFAKVQPALAKEVRKSERLLREMATYKSSQVSKSIGSMLKSQCFDLFQSPKHENSSSLDNSILLSPSLLQHCELSSSKKSEQKEKISLSRKDFFDSRFNALLRASTQSQGNEISLPGCNENNVGPPTIVQPHSSHITVTQAAQTSFSSRSQTVEVWPLQLLDMIEKRRTTQQSTQSRSHHLATSQQRASQSTSNSAQKQIQNTDMNKVAKSTNRIETQPVTQAINKDSKRAPIYNAPASLSSNNNFSMSSDQGKFTRPNECSLPSSERSISSSQKNNLKSFHDKSLHVPSESKKSIKTNIDSPNLHKNVSGSYQQ